MAATPPPAGTLPPGTPPETVPPGSLVPAPRPPLGVETPPGTAPGTTAGVGGLAQGTATAATPPGAGLRSPRRASDLLPVPESARRRRTVQLAACLALLATVLYLLWRTAASLEGSTLWLSVPLLLLEVHAAISLALFTHDLWDVDVRPDPRALPPTDRQDVDALRVAVLIPTYNEPRAVLLPTIVAAVATHRPHDTWVLDDGDRPWVRELAEELGARYRSRSGGLHAKAGNINEALAEVAADVVAVVDADHVVTEGFLDALVPYFADPRVAIVQSPQEFYNSSSFEHVARPDGGMFADQEMFYRAVLAGRNRWGAPFWCGTGALVRAEALRSVGGVATESVTEDIQTTLRMHRQGWRTVHHNEVLAHGLAADHPDAFFTQRIRWGAGAMQVLHRDNPLRGRGLTPHQRLSYLSTLLGWFESWRTVGYVLLPVATLLSGGLPVSAEWRTFLVAFLVSFALQRVALRLLSRGRAPLLHATFFEFVRLPATFAATLAVFGTGPSGFAVTPKSAVDQRVRADFPVILTWLMALTVVAGAWYIATVAGLTRTDYAVPWVAHGAAFWLAVNGALLVAAQHRIRQIRFAGNRRDAWRFSTDLPVDVELPDGTRVTAALTDVSITGARLTFDLFGSDLQEDDDVVVHVPVAGAGGSAEVLTLPATLRAVGTDRATGARWAGTLLRTTTAQQARLALALYRTA